MITWYPAIGETVHKRYFEGWSGKVARLVDERHVEVLWDLGKHPTFTAVDDLRAQGERFRGHRRNAA